MSDKELAELHAQGPDALRAGAWEVVDQELRRRERVKARHSPFPEVEEEKYPAIRTTVILLKVLAALALVAGILGAIVEAAEGGILVAVLFLLAGLLGAVSYWAGAELLVLLLDIEANTRTLRKRLE